MFRKDSTRTGLLVIAISVCQLFLHSGCSSDSGSGESTSAGSNPAENPPVRTATDNGTWEVTPSELRARLRANEMARFRMSGNKIVRAELFQSGISSIAELRGLPLEFIDLGMTDVSDLSPLAGMPLKEIVLENTPVSDISILKEMPLEVVKLQSTKVTDLTPIYGLKLRQLNLMSLPIKDLQPFSGMPLETLWIPQTQVQDLTPIREMKTLVSLDIQGTPVTSLEPIQSLSGLRRLNIADSAVEDLTPLKDLNLERLTLTPQKIRKGMEVIRGMTSLVEIQPSLETPMTAADFWKRYDLGVWPVPATP